MTIEIPEWCIIGKCIAWSNEVATGAKWVREKIIAYGIDGFFHQASYCPVYYSRFSEYGKTVKEEEEVFQCKIT